MSSARRRRISVALKSRPAAFMHARNAALITIGNLEDDLDKVKDCDLIIEAIIAVGAHIGLLFLACRPEQFESRAQNEVRRASEAVMSRSDQAIRGLDDLGSGMLEQVQ